MSTITIIEGNNNDKDNTRAIMVKGETGATISTIAKTGTSGLVDTYTVTLSDGRTQTFTVTNGKSITSIEKTGTSGLVDTYTITYNDNTTQTFTVTNGYSPTATVSKTNAVTTISITDQNGTTTAEINDAVGYEVPANSVIGWDSNGAIPAGYEDTGDTFGGGNPTGVVLEFAGATAPTGYLLCDGSAVSRTTYASLFDVIGTTYGTGDGSTTFNIPNCKGRVVVGYNSSDTAFDSLGETGGEKTHTLTTNEMPSHNHGVTGGTVAGSGTSYAGGSGLSVPNPTSNIYISNSGGGQAHNNLQPYIVMNYIIKI